MRSRRTVRKVCAAIESVEPRRLLAAVFWDGGGDGINWTSANNWSTNALPGPSDDVTIDIATNPNLILPSGNQNIRSLVLNEVLRINGGTLTISTTADVNAPLTIGGGTIAGGAWDVTGGSLLASTSGGVINNAAITGDILLNATSASVRLAGSTTFNNARLSANNVTLQMSPGYTLNNTVIAEGATAGTRNISLAVGGAGTVTFSPTAVVRLAAGSGGGLDIQNSSTATLVNNGLISAEAANQTLRTLNSTLTNNGTLSLSSGTLTLQSTAYTNTGTITASGGTLSLAGTFNTGGGIGTMNTSAATVNVVGTIANAGNTITLNATTGSWNMFGGTLDGGNLNLTSGTALRTTNSGGVLNNIAIAGDVLLNVTSASIRLAGSTTFANARLSANNVTLQMSPGYTLTNTVIAEGATAGTRNISLAASGAGTVTFAPSAVVRLAAGTGAGLDIQNSSAATLINNGLISAEAANQTLRINNTSLTNNGTLSVSTGTLTIGATTWTNPGTVSATGGTVRLEGTFVTAGGIGTMNTSAASAVNVVGTVNNVGGTINLNATTGSWSMLGGTINGGSLNLGGSTSVLTTTSGGTLDSVSINGNILLNVTSASVRLAGTTTFTTARLSANNVTLGMAPGYTLSNTVLSEGAATGTRNISLANGGAGTVTFAPSAIVRLVTGSGGSLDIQNSSSATLINNGLISAEAANQTLRIIPTNMTNNGTLAVTAGTLTVAGTTWNNTGTISGTGGTIRFEGTFDTTGGAGTLNTAASTVNIVGTINNTGNTLILNAATGSWQVLGGTISGGNLNLTAGTNLLTTTLSGLLNNVAIAGDILLNTTSASIRLAGSTTFTTARLTANNTTLGMAPGYTLNNTVLAEGATTGTRNISLANGGVGTVTFSPTAIVRLTPGTGAGLDLQNSSAATLINNGLISAEAANQTLRIFNTTFTNNGTLSVSAGTLSIGATTWSNAGTISASGGTVQLDGTFDATGGIGTLNTAAATVNVVGTINNTGSTITLNANTGSLRMFGGTISGGNVNLLADTAILTSTSGGILNNVAISGDVLLNVTSASVRLAGTTTFTTARLTANNTTLGMAPGYTLSNTVLAEGAATGNRNIALAQSGAGTVNFAPSAVVRLMPGSGGGLDIQNSSTATLINEGLISAEAAGRSLRILTAGFSNLAAGTIRADGSTIELLTPVGLAGTLASPGIWQLRNGARLSTNFNAIVVDLNLSIAGTNNAFAGNLVSAANGVNELRNSWSFANGATFNITPAGGTLKLAGVVDLAPDARLNVTGGLRFAGANPTTVRTGIASASSMGRIAASGVVDLSNPDGGQVRFDPDLVGGYDPASGTRFDAITGSNVINDLGAFFGDTTPSGRILLVGRDNTALYSVVGTGTPPPAPSIVNTVFEFLTREAVNFTFNSNVSAFVSRNDLKITNLGTNQIVPNTQGVMSYDPAGLTASLLTGGANALPNGKYRIEIQASDISNAAGQPLTTPLTFEFFILRGDANRDRVVNFDDLLIVAQNYGQSGRNFSQGNFNYSADGLVNFDDLLIVAQNYGVSVPALALEVTPTQSKRERSASVTDVIA